MFLGIMAKGIPGTKEEGKEKYFTVDLHNRTVLVNDVKDNQLQKNDQLAENDKFFALYGNLNLQHGGILSFPVARGDKLYGMVIESIQEWEAAEQLLPKEMTIFECQTKSSSYRIQAQPNGLFAMGGVFERDREKFPNGWSQLSVMPMIEEGKPMNLQLIDGREVNTGNIITTNVYKEAFPMDEVRIEPIPGTIKQIENYREAEGKEI